MQTAVSAARALSTEHIRRHYDDFSWAYRLYWGDHIHHGLFVKGDESPQQAQEQMLRYCVQQAGIQAGMTVADVGCGHGGTVRFLAGEHGCRVLGITLSPSQLKLAGKLSTEHLQRGLAHFELADAERYSFPAEHFDVVWNMESAEHFFDKPGYFRKAAAALKPGGTLMLAAWSGSMADVSVERIAEIFLCPELFTAQEYQNAIEEAGLTVISCERLAREVVRTWDICSEHVQAAAPMLRLLPEKYSTFAEGIELMRECYRNGQLTYTIMIARKIVR